MNRKSITGKQVLARCLGPIGGCLLLALAIYLIFSGILPFFVMIAGYILVLIIILAPLWRLLARYTAGSEEG